MTHEYGAMTHSTLEEGTDFHITDKWHKEHLFKISTFLCPTGMLSEAIEIQDKKGFEPYQFTLFSADENVDIEKQELLLKAKIKKGVNQRYLDEENGDYYIGDENKLKGRVEFNDNFSDTDFENILVIDGKRITVEQFAKLLSSYEG